MAHRFVRNLTVSSKSTANTYSVGTNLFTNANGVVAQEVYFTNGSTGTSYGVVVDSTTIANVTDFQIAFARANGKLDVSPLNPLRKTSIRKATKETYSAGVDEIQYFGYDGATAGLDLNVIKGTGTYGNTYGFLTTIITDTTFQDLYKPYAIYRSTDTFAASTPTTPEKLAYLYQFIGDFNGAVNEVNSRLFRAGSENVSKYIDATLLSSGTHTAIAGAVTVAYDSTIATIVAHNVTAGTYLRIGGATATTNTTYGIYKVESVIDANTVQLSTPYKGANIAAVAGASAVFAAVTPTFGIKLTVKPNAAPYDKLSGVTTVQFDASFALRDQNESSLDLGYVATKTVVPAKWSSGAENSVRELEYDQLPQKGFTNKTMWPVLEPTSYVTAGINYDLYTIVYYRESETGLQALDDKPRQEMIAVPTGSTLSTYITGVVSALPNYSAI